MQIHSLEQNETIYTVSRLNNEVRFLLEEAYPFVWVEGEISNFSAPNSGHWYFCLKDASAQINCAMFRGSQRKLNFTPRDGMHVLLKGRVSLYENSGRYQLIADDMEERGEGKLRRAYEALKKKLEGAGLFDATHKKLLPRFPEQIGVVTSKTGAAIRDILTVLKRRYPCAEVVIYHTLVQGEMAASQIVNAIQTADRRKECDILILARGGGSLEDLWPFNEEIVAQAIYQCEIPIVSGVGHEVDFTIADFVADQRAPTPSAAAEMITPDTNELEQNFKRSHLQLNRILMRRLKDVRERLTWMQKHLNQQHPKRRLTEKMQRLDFCELAFIQLQTRQINSLRERLQNLDIRLQKSTPRYLLQTHQNSVHMFEQQLQQAFTAKIQSAQTRLANAAAKLDALSPLGTLKRGYAITTTPDGRILQDATSVPLGTKVIVKLMNGELDCTVDKTRS